MTATLTPHPVDRFLDLLKAIPFIRRASFTPSRKGERFDGMVTLRTDQGAFSLAVELKLSYLDRASTHAISAVATLSQREGHPLFLFARYVPRPTGEQLAAAGVNFIDLAGNMHLALGRKYARTILGRREGQTPHGKRPITAAKLQVLFLFVAEPEALAWPVRQIAVKAGISKSNAAQIRHQLIENKQIKPHPKKGETWPPREIERLLVSGYAEILRPKLLLGRFRSPEAKGEDFIARLPKDLAPLGVRFSLTGGPAAGRLQHFYQGPEMPIFLDQWNPEIQKRLRLLPDRQGPVMVLGAFGAPVFWRAKGAVTVAHPWLIYAELMNSEDPRAHEAAEELRREFLPE